jgi:putative transposase
VCKNFKYRLYPTKAQERKLELTLDLCRELYNAALEERRSAYKMCGVSLNYYDQQNQLPAIKEVRSDLCQVFSQVLQDVLRRIDKGFKAFFARCKRGEIPGFPRFQGKGRYASFTYPQAGWSLHNDKLTLSKIGTIKVRLHRDVIGKAKTCTIKREGRGWFVIFSIEYELDAPDYHQGPVVGIDFGLEHFLNQSDGVQVENPRFFRKAQKHLAKVQRKFSSLKHLPKSNPTKRKAKKALNRAHAKVRNQRQDFAHKLSKELASTYSLIVVEDLKIKNLMARPKPKEDENQVGHYLPNGASAKSGLAKSIADAGWSGFISLLKNKVEYTGSRVIEVNPKQTSQICPKCGAIQEKKLSERWHSCPCGCSMHRDIAAARVILSRGLATVGNQSVDAPPFRSGE